MDIPLDPEALFPRLKKENHCEEWMRKLNVESHCYPGDTRRPEKARGQRKQTLSR